MPVLSFSVFPRAPRTSRVPRGSFPHQENQGNEMDRALIECDEDLIGKVLTAATEVSVRSRGLAARGRVR